MPRPAPNSAIRTGVVLERAVPIIELSSLARVRRDAVEVEEIGDDDVLDDTMEAEPLRRPAPPVIPSINRSTHAEPPPPVSRSEAARARRGPSIWAMLATVLVLGGLGALAGFGMRSLARAPTVGASTLLSSAAMSAPGDREQRWRAAPRVSVEAPPAPPTLASPPMPLAAAASPVARRATPQKHVAPVRPHPPRALHAAHAQHTPVKPATGSRAPQTKKKAKH
jgi:hypothetical protein